MKRTLAAAVGLSVVLAGCGSSAAGRPASASDRGLARPVSLEDARIGPLPAPARPDAAALVRRYNDRDLGSPGWRRVSLEIVTKGEVKRRFAVLTLWRRSRRDLRSMFALEAPDALSGTNYLLVEAGDFLPLGMRVHLFLPLGDRRVLEIAPANFDEGLLGSEFTYLDERLQLPSRGISYAVTGTSVLQGEPVWAIEARPASAAERAICSWEMARFFLARRVPVVLGADYYSEGSGSPRLLRRMRVEGVRRFGEVWMGSKMTMSDESGHASVLTLAAAGFHQRALEALRFSNEELEALSDRIRARRTAAAGGASAGIGGIIP